MATMVDLAVVLFVGCLIAKVAMRVSAPIMEHRDNVRDEREDMEVYFIRMERCASQHNVPRDIFEEKWRFFEENVPPKARRDVFNDLMNELRHYDDNSRF